MKERFVEVVHWVIRMSDGEYVRMWRGHPAESVPRKYRFLASRWMTSKDARSVARKLRKLGHQCNVVRIVRDAKDW
jgi:hypothetical protein